MGAVSLGLLTLFVGVVVIVALFGGFDYKGKK